MKRKCKYKIWDIVCVALLATISNCDEWEEIEMFAIKKGIAKKIFVVNRRYSISPNI